MQDLIGTILSQRYRVVQFAGHGGMADVYKVWDTQRSVHLAMKVLREDLAEDEIFLRRFRREAEILTRLQHPFIIRSYGLVQSDGLAFLLMDFIEGSTLRKEIFNRKTPWTLEQVFAVMRPVCSALNFAHTQGLVHCDVKPANIMITLARDILLADFGIARLTESATTATMVGAGTPAYMAPEQVRGEDPCPQTDIYALGIILFELLTGGERPFIGDHAQTTGSSGEKVRWEHVHRTPPSPRQFNPQVSTEIEAILFKCLEKDPAQRYASTMELLSALEQAGPVAQETAVVSQEIPVPVLSDDPVTQVTPPPAAQPDLSSLPVSGQDVGRKERKRFRLRWGIIVGLVGTILLGAIALFVFPPGSLSVPPVQPLLTPTSLFQTRPPQAELTQTVTLSSAFPVCTQMGQKWTSAQDGMVLLCVPSGNFLMGAGDDDKEASAVERPQHSVKLDAYWIDRTEVTNGMYAACVKARGCEAPFETKSNTRQSYYGDPSYAAYPVIYVNWYQAQAYCAWAGRKLPTEAEWEKAARGMAGFIYPWGNTPPGNQHLNLGNDPNDTGPVDQYPAGASPYGALNMAGNVWEWVADWYSETYYTSAQVNNPTGPIGGDFKVLRGGPWGYITRNVRSSNRESYNPKIRYFNIGFRCAY